MRADVRRRWGFDKRQYRHGITVLKRKKIGAFICSAIGLCKSGIPRKFLSINMIPNEKWSSGNAPGTRYSAVNQAERQPPSQAQLELRQHAQTHDGLHQHLFPVSAAASSEWGRPIGVRWKENAILVGLWLLILLAAVAVYLRFLDETAPDAAGAMRGAAAQAMPDRSKPLPMASPLVDTSDPFEDSPSLPTANLAPTTVTAKPQRASAMPVASQQTLSAANEATALSAAESLALPVSHKSPALVSQGAADAYPGHSQARMTRHGGSTMSAPKANRAKEAKCSAALQAMQLCEVRPAE
jgi:hypothetical protein